MTGNGSGRKTLVNWMRGALAASLLATPVPSFAAPAQSRLGAVPQFRDALRTSVYGNYIAGLVATSARDAEAASTFWRAALRHDPRNGDLVEKAFYASMVNGDLDEAFPLAERLVQVDKGNRLGRLALAVKAAKDKQWVQVRKELQLASAPLGDVASVLMMAWAQAGSGRTDEAVKVLDKLGDQDWFLLYKTYQQGLLLDINGQSAKAGPKLEAAHKQNTSFLRAADAYGRWLARNKSPEEARALYSAFSKSVMAHPMAEAMQADLIAGKKPEPLVTTNQQGMAEALFGLGTALSRQEGNEGQALIYLQLAVALAPDFDMALFAIGEVFDQMKQYDKAIAAYRRVPASSPLKRNSDMQVALTLENAERHEESTAQLKGLIDANPKDIEAVQLLGSVYRTRKMFKEAEATYTKAIQLVETPLPQHWVLYYFRGVANERLKDWPKAEADFKTALDLVPATNGTGKAQVLNYLGYSWIDQGLNLEEGLKYIKQAVELQPDSGYIVDSLGWAYYRMGRYNDAVVELERAIELKPDDPVLNDHLGDAYWKVGRETEARFQWNHARDYKPEPDDLARILEKLKNGLTSTAANEAPAPIPPAPLQDPPKPN